MKSKKYNETRDKTMGIIDGVGSSLKPLVVLITKLAVVGAILFGIFIAVIIAFD